MSRYLRTIEDSHGDLIDMEVYCSSQCWRDAGLGDPHGFAYPAPEKADYDQHCPQCGTVTVAAIGSPSFDGWPVTV
jgi:hypothetical protein